MLLEALLPPIYYNYQAYVVLIQLFAFANFTVPDGVDAALRALRNIDWLQQFRAYCIICNRQGCTALVSYRMIPSCISFIVAPSEWQTSDYWQPAVITIRLSEQPVSTIFPIPEHRLYYTIGLADWPDVQDSSLQRRSCSEHFWCCCSEPEEATIIL